MTLLGQPPNEITETDLVIVGGGVAGLSAARWLRKSGIRSFRLLELEPQLGGNAASGQNEVSPYPWGAHYLPLPNPDQHDLKDFLREIGVITCFDTKGLPHYNEYYLCADPKERLFIHGHWQDGLLPHFGVPDADQKQIEDFINRMHTFRDTQGRDGKYAFTLPVDNSSADVEFRQLDTQTMYDYLQTHGFTSPYLHWYVDYCCRDDYGTSLKDTSAWAGIHYFAARRGTAANAETNSVLTWPEGNSWLVHQLKHGLEDYIQANTLVYSVQMAEKEVLVDLLDVKTNKTRRIKAKKCILASPQFVNARILQPGAHRNQAFYGRYTYSPWMVANITLKHLPDRNGSPLSWDNVLYGSTSLGYVNAKHQNLSSNQGKQKVQLTYYRPLADQDPVTARTEALRKKHAEWTENIITDLSKAHPGIAKEIDNIDIWLWGHGMVRPTPGFIWSKPRQQAVQSLGNTIFFAHSDLSGISLFEEAFHHGIRAAKEAIGIG